MFRDDLNELAYLAGKLTDFSDIEQDFKFLFKLCVNRLIKDYDNIHKEAKELNCLEQKKKYLTEKIRYLRQKNQKILSNFAAQKKAIAEEIEHMEKDRNRLKGLELENKILKYQLAQVRKDKINSIPGKRSRLFEW